MTNPTDLSDAIELARLYRRPVKTAMGIVMPNGRLHKVRSRRVRRARTLFDHEKFAAIHAAIERKD